MSAVRLRGSRPSVGSGACAQRGSGPAGSRLWEGKHLQICRCLGLLLGLALLLTQVSCAPQRAALQPAGAQRPVGTPSHDSRGEEGRGAPTPTVPTTRGTAVGQLAPELSLPGLDGQMVDLGDYRGQVVLLNFWATWCGPCRGEVPELVAAFERYKGRGFTVLAVNLGETEERVRAFADRYGMDFPVLLDPSAHTQRIYPSRGIPTSFLLDRDGIVRRVLVGAADEQTLARLIEPLL